MIEILICDDDGYITKDLSKHILDRISSNNLNASVKSFFSGDSLLNYLQKTIQRKRMILLDIEMKNKDGLTVAKYIRNVLNDYTTEIIFVTGTNGYERALFEVRPSGFITKPINYDYLYSTLNRVYNLLNIEHEYFTYYQHGVEKSIRLNDIVYFESMSRKIELNTVDYTDWFYEKMSSLKHQLITHPQFVLCHRSFIINCKQIKRKDGANLIMTNDSSIPISNKKLKSVEEALIQFM